MIRLKLKEKQKDGKSLENTFSRNVLMLFLIVHSMTNLGMSSFTSLKRKKNLPNKRERRSKKTKNATKAEDAQAKGERII